MDFDMDKPDNRAAVYDIFYRADSNMWAQKWLISSHRLEFPDVLIKKRLILWHFYIHLYKVKDIYYTNFGSAWFYGGVSRTQLVLPEFDLGRLCGMTLYEIISLAIDLAILILTALSYLKNRKS